MLFTLCFDDHCDLHIGPNHPDEAREPMDEDADYATLDELIATAGDSAGDSEDANSEWERFVERRWLR